ncbi:MAG: hypothetical protein ACLU60_02325 [Faecalimonas sp.]
MLKLGYAEIDITPDTPMSLIGFNREDDMSRGVLKSLIAQVSVWENEERCCLICIDSIGFAKHLADSLRMKVSKVLNVSRDKVMLCFSHCHSAPDADNMPHYYEMVCKKIELAAERALSVMQPVLCGWTNVEAEIGVNRREGNTSLDKRVGLLKVSEESKDDMHLLLVRVTAHCNVLKSDNYLISPDYFGAIRDVLQRKFGCPVMVIQGSAGNIAPKYFKSANTPIDARGTEYIRSNTALEDMANSIYEKVVDVIENIEVMSNLSAKMYSIDTVLHSNVPSLERAEQIATEAKHYCNIDGTEWLTEVNRLHRAGVAQQEDEIEIQYFSIGQWCMCGVPYELMVEFALECMKKKNDAYFYVNGYTNGCLSYFPTEEEYELGGYEVYWSLLIYFKYFNRVFPLEKESASKLIDCILYESEMK